VTALAFEGHDLQPIQSFEELRWWITRAAMQQENLQVERQDASGAHLGGLVLPLARLAGASVDSEMFQSVGIVSPMRSAVLREVKEGGPGYRAGLKAQDVVL
jgi:regulator of sigma E protease